MLNHLTELLGEDLDHVALALRAVTVVVRSNPARGAAVRDMRRAA